MAEVGATDGSGGRTADAGNSSDEIEFISFSIGEDQYGVEIIAVREIKGWTKITHLPNQPDYVRGVLNLRGAMVPIIDLRCRFGEGVTQETPMHVVIVVQIQSRLVGILADRVLDIVSIDARKIQPVPNVTNEKQARLLSGLTTVGDSMLALIKLDRLLEGGEDVTISDTRAA
jgi:purine-binding chemotaxis protein CheW